MTRFAWRMLMPTIALVMAADARAQSVLPDLKFDDPPNFYRSASYPPADFSSTEVNASLQVYPFRPFNGDVRQAFARTLFRELIDPRYQESNVGAPGPRLDVITVPGAREVLRARFTEIVGGLPHERLRMVIVADGAIAILDASAINMASWQRVLQPLNVFSASLRVVAGAPATDYTAAPGAAGRNVAGLYMGFKRKLMSDLQRGAGNFSYINALHYYLFSANGRVYRAYDGIDVPGNDPARFDFAGAERADPVNSGRYIVKGDSVYMRLGTSQQPETLAFRLPRDTRTLSIEAVSYTRQ